MTDQAVLGAFRRSRAPKGEGDRLRDDILDAAEGILVRVGNEEDVSIRAIAEAVGVTPPSIYRHFSDKENLLTQICERRFADLNAAFDDAVGSVTDPLERLHALGRAYGRFALEHPEQYRVLMMTTSARRKPLDDEGFVQGSTAFQYLVDAIIACEEAGFIAPELDALQVAVVMWSAIHGLVSLLITRPQFEWPAPSHELIELVMEVHLRGVLPDRLDQGGVARATRRSPQDP